MALNELAMYRKNLVRPNSQPRQQAESKAVVQQEGMPIRQPHRGGWYGSRNRLVDKYRADNRPIEP